MHVLLTQKHSRQHICTKAFCISALPHYHNVVHSLTHALTHSLAHSLTHSLTHYHAAAESEQLQRREAAVVEREIVVSGREASAVDAEVHSLTVSLFANVKTAMLDEDRADLAAQQAANADRAERLVDAQVDAVLSSLVLDLERSLLADEADALTAQRVKTAQGELQSWCCICVDLFQLVV